MSLETLQSVEQDTLQEKTEKELWEIKKMENDLEKEIIEKYEQNSKIIREDLQNIDTSWIDINIKEWKGKLEIEVYHNEWDLKIKKYEWETSFFRMKNGNIHIKNSEQKILLYTNEKDFNTKAYSDIKENITSAVFKEINISRIDDATRNLIIKKINMYSGIIYNSLKIKNSSIQRVEKSWDNIIIPLSRNWKKIIINITDETNWLEEFMNQQERKVNNKEKQTGKKNSILIDFCENCREQIPEEIRKDIKEKDQYTLFYPKFAQAFSKL